MKAYILNKNALLKAVALSLVMLLGVTATKAQGDTTYLMGYIKSDMTLKGNTTYVLDLNTKVDKGAVLTIEAGATLLLEPDITLVIEGGLQMNGSPNNFITLTNYDALNPGGGIIVRGSEGKDVAINYTKFLGVNAPLEFEMDWYRENITFEHNIIKECRPGESLVVIATPSSLYQYTTDRKTNFSFQYNQFVNNWGGIYVENLQDNIMDFRFNYNVLINNVSYGIDYGVPANAPFFGYYDDENRRFIAEMKQNSSFGNYQIDASTDTIVREINFGIAGDGETFNLANNFFRSQDKDYISNTFDDFHHNVQLPLYDIEPVLQQPSEEAPAHIYKVRMNGEDIENYAEIPDVGTNNVSFEVYFNRAVDEINDLHLQAVFYDTINGDLVTNDVDLFDGSFTTDNKVYTFTVENATFLRNSLGYVTLSNFKDDEGFPVPVFSIGQPNAINNYSQLVNRGLEDQMYSASEMITGMGPGGVGMGVTDEKDLEVLEQLSDMGDLSYLGAYTSLAKTWEVGLTLATANYMGDLTDNLMDKDDFRWNFGIWGQYNINKWFSARLAFQGLRIMGSDLDESELGRQKRVANFRNDMWDLSATFHFHVLQYGISKGEKFSPSIFIGVSGFYHNPEARIFTGLDPESGDATYLAYIDDIFTYATEEEANRQEFVWVPLRDVGTEGQTTNETDPEFSREAPQQYSKFGIGIPMGVSFDFIINKSWVIGIEGRFTLAFTDYLDDVSGFYYDRTVDASTGNPHQAIIDANTVIQGNAGGETVTLPNEVTVINPQTAEIPVPTAALLANPSLANAVYLSPQGEIKYNQGPNDAHTFPSARKGDPNRDWYSYFGIKVSKVFGYNKYKRKADKKKKKTGTDDEDEIQLL